MLVRGIIGSFLLFGFISIHAYEKGAKSHEFSGERGDVLKYQDRSYEQRKGHEPKNEFNKKIYKELKKDGKYQNEKDYKKEWKYQNEKDHKKEWKYQNEKDYKKEGKYHTIKDYKRDAKQQFEKDHKHWNKQLKQEHSQEKQSKFMKENGDGSQEYVDKFNKYGKIFDPNLVDKSYKKQKEGPHEKHSEKFEKPKTLLHDTNVNYVEGNKNVNKDSELINRESHSGEFEKPKTLLHDTNLNHVKRNKNVDRDRELINEDSKDFLITKEKYEENYQNKDELFEKRYKKNFLENLKTIDLSNPPINDTVMLARFIVHSIDWVSMATLTSRISSSLAPFACVKSMSDGELNLSSGIPFFYMSHLDLCAADLKKNNKVSLLMTLSQTDYCKNKAYDPQDPRCAKIMMTGRIRWLEPESEEGKFAEKAMFSRHPIMKSWPVDHSWKFAKMDIEEILLLYRFGGPAKINLDDYFNGQSTEFSEENSEVLIS